MFVNMSLRVKIALLLFLLITVTLSGAFVTIWYADRTDELFGSVADRDVNALRAAEELQLSLAMQKGYVTYFYLYGEPKWLDALNEFHHRFKDLLTTARSTARLDSEIDILNRIESGYVRYTFFRNQVIKLYEEGNRDKGALLHEDVRARFHEIYGLCDEYKSRFIRSISEARKQSSKRVGAITSLAVGASLGVCFLGAILGYILFHQILSPIRRLALESKPETPRKRGIDDEVKALSERVHGLMEDVDATKNRLEASQEHLMQSEKWAVVGKLAAGMAHSVRNPLTSVKMRLFSIGRSMNMSETEKEDFEVIYEEIRHIDTIVQNFLEFSRPPKLKMQDVHLSEVVETTLQLLRHRMESYGITVEVKKAEASPMVHADPEQLKEAMVNLLVNACDAMREGGKIIIEEEAHKGDGEGADAVIRISDTGPGIPESVREKVFQPFFSTKEEGTGLGLCISARIIESHGGALDFTSEEGVGTTFIIKLKSSARG